MSTEPGSGIDPAGAGTRRLFPVRFLVYGVVVAAGLAVVVPSFLRARVSRGESPHIGQIRTMLSAQEAYRAANNGFYDHPRCVADPRPCIPSYAGPAFIDATMLAETRYGYRWTFHPGPPASPLAIGAAHSSPSSLEAFAYVAVPVESGKAGLRGYCGDATGLICFTTDGATPRVESGACSRDPRCQPLR